MPPTSQKLIVGLGNPGSQYAKTRHNAGFMLIDRLSPASSIPKSRFQSSLIDAELAGQRCLLLKPLTFMNRSGQAVAEALSFFKLSPASDLLVIVDDLYLPCGSLRLRPSGGTGGHNGLEDITRALASDAYPRLRIGVGMLPSGGKPPQFDQADYVLSRFADDELPLVDAAIKKAAPGVELWATKGLTAAMNRLNAPDPAPPKSPPPT